MNTRRFAISCMVMCIAQLAQAQSEPVRKTLNLDNLNNSSGLTRFYMSPTTLHYSSSPEHKPVRMFGGEKQYASGELLGGAVFSNSFGQESATLYRGARLNNWSSSEKVYAQLVAGLMYGYKPPYDREVPLNYKGFSPMAVVAVGWQLTPYYAVQLNALGTAALMLQLSMATP